MAVPSSVWLVTSMPSQQTNSLLSRYTLLSMRTLSFGRLIYLVYLFTIALPILLLITGGSSVLLIIASYARVPASFISQVTKFWSWSCLTLTLCRVEVRGREHLPQRGSACVVVANHQSAYDICALNACIGIPFKWVMKADLRRMPLVGRACEASGFIFVDETRVSSITHTIEDAKRVLSTGNSIFIFPEGSRTETGRMTRFKKGAFVMASELDVPILPVTIDGAFAILPRGCSIPHRHRIVLTIHPPFHMSEQGTPPAHIPASARLAQQMIASALSEEG